MSLVKVLYFQKYTKNIIDLIINIYRVPMKAWNKHKMSGHVFYIRSNYQVKQTSKWMWCGPSVISFIQAKISMDYFCGPFQILWDERALICRSKYSFYNCNCIHCFIIFGLAHYIKLYSIILALLWIIIIGLRKYVLRCITIHNKMGLRHLHNIKYNERPFIKNACNSNLLVQRLTKYLRIKSFILYC